jgi:hypothetical protein
VATIVSAIVGSAIFLTFSSQIGLGKDHFSLPAQGWPLLFAIVICVLSVLAPILNAVAGRVNDAGQAATHRALKKDYSDLQRKIDIFLLSYPDPNLSPERREEALKKLKEISDGIDAVHPELTLTPHAIARAKERTRTREPGT